MKTWYEINGRLDEDASAMRKHNAARQKFKAYRMERGRTLGTLRTQWCLDLNRDKGQHGRSYPLIIWSAARADLESA